MSIVREIRKITCPALPPTTLYRDVLVARLDAVIAGSDAGFPDYKLVLLYAPAGYGKTTLLVHFVKKTQIACCWYVMDQADADKNTFLGTLLASIRVKFPNFGSALDMLLAATIVADAERPGRLRYESIIDELVAAMKAEINERLVIILCNYQEVNSSQAVNDLMNQLLRKLPTHCVLVIESRSTPDLEFAPLLARREMVGIGSTILHFNAQEIRDLACLQGAASLSEAEATQLALTFEGWITGILLGTHLGGVQFLPHAGSNKVTGEAQPQSQRDRYHLFSYVVNEVFERNPEVYTFLKEASLLQEMTAAVCGELLGITDAQERLNYLEQNGLFVTRRGEGKQAIYLYHPVLRELFYEDLRRQSPERFVELHQHAAEIMSRNNNYEKAIYHALEASANDIAGRLIIDAHEQMLSQGHVEMLARWIDCLPNLTMARYPWLLLIRADIYLRTSNYTIAMGLIDRFTTAFMLPDCQHNAEDLQHLQIESLILRSKALFQSGEYHQALLICQQVQECIPADEVRRKADIHYRLGLCANLLGDFATGIKELQRALQLWGRHTIERRSAEIHSSLATTYSLLGNFALSEHHITRSKILWNQLHDKWGKFYALLTEGNIKQRQGAFQQSEESFHQALILAREPLPFELGEAYALTSLGDLYQDQALYDRSLPMLEDGLELARRAKDKYLVNFALCILAMTYVYMGDAGMALLLVSEAEVQSGQGEFFSYEEAVRELTYGTILLYQSRYEESYCHLSLLEVSLKKMGLKREHIQTLLRMASCLLEQEKEQDKKWLPLLNEIVSILKIQGGYEYQVLVELGRLRKVYQVVETYPELKPLRELLHLSIEEIVSPEGAAPAPPFAETAAITVLEDVQQVPVATPVPMISDRAHIEIQGLAEGHRIAIWALGEPVVTLQDRPITRWRMARSMELFFFLLDRGRPTRKEQIITDLWAEVDEQINQTFHSTIYYLRKALEGDRCVVSQGSIYTLDLTTYFGSNVWYDVMEFQRHQEEAKLALAQEDEIAAKDALLTMVELYRGDYVQPFYSDWCNFRRDELRRAYLDARRQLALMAWKQEQFDECAMHWQHTLAIDDCQEDAHYWLMRCYMRQGKRGLALRQYQRCRDVLQSEMNIQPGNAVQNLYQRLMGQT